MEALGWIGSDDLVGGSVTNTWFSVSPSCKISLGGGSSVVYAVGCVFVVILLDHAAVCCE